MSKHECAPECPIHHRPLLCPSCLGARGGAKTSPAKKKSSAKNGKLGAAARWSKLKKAP